MADKKIRQSKSSVLFFGAPGGTRLAARDAPWSSAALTCHRHIIQYRSSFESLQIAKKRQPSNPRIERLSFGAPGGTRTRDLLIRSQTLYPAELRAHMPSINDSFTIILDWRTKVKTFPQIPALPEKHLPVLFRSGREESLPILTNPEIPADAFEHCLRTFSAKLRDPPLRSP